DIHPDGQNGLGKARDRVREEPGGAKNRPALIWEIGVGEGYNVEDLHTAYWPEYQGGLRKPGSFIDQGPHQRIECRPLARGAPIDGLHAIDCFDALLRQRRGLRARSAFTQTRSTIGQPEVA